MTALRSIQQTLASRAERSQAPGPASTQPSARAAARPGRPAEADLFEAGRPRRSTWRAGLRPTVAVLLLTGLAVGLVFLVRGDRGNRAAPLAVRLKDATNEPEPVHTEIATSREAADPARRPSPPPGPTQPTGTPAPRMAATAPIPVQAPRPPPPDETDVAAVSGLVEEVRSAVAGRDLVSVRQAVRLQPSGERLLEELFGAYQEVQLAVERIDLTPDTATVLVAFDRLINRAGQQVIPGDTWRQATLRLVKRSGHWEQPVWETRPAGAGAMPGPRPPP